MIEDDVVVFKEEFGIEIIRLEKNVKLDFHGSTSWG